MNETLYKKVLKLDLPIEHVAEVGVFYPETSNVLGFIHDGKKTDLFEPDPLCVEKIEEAFSGYKNVTLYPYAIYDKKEKIGLYRTNASTFVKGLEASPALVNDKYQPKEEDLFEAEGRLFSEFDDGTIDVLSIDTEGCEWYVLKNMVSEPKIISVETHGKKYRNTYYKEIMSWMENHDYRKWYADGSDTVFIKKDIKFPLLSKWF